jgi:uncharacterized protein
MVFATGIQLLLIGIIAGGYGTIVGAGGGFIFVPALLLIFKMEPSIAAGTGLVIVLINSLSGVFGYARKKKINYRTGITIGIGALPGAVVGVWLLQVYSSSYFYVVFATILLFLGIFLFVKNSPFSKAMEKQKHVNYIKKTEDPSAVSLEEKTKNPTPKTKWLLPLGFIMGILSSYLGIGGGWLLVPILIYFFGVSTHNATATSIFSLCLYSSIGVISQLYYSTIDWSAVFWGGLGVIIGAQFGVFLSQKIPGKVILQMLSVLLIVIGFRMYLN